MTTAIAIGAVLAALLAVSALFVAAEFAIVSSRRSRLAHMAAEGDHRAAALHSIASDGRKLDAYVATCQVGITLSNLAVGFYGQGTVTDTVTPMLYGLGMARATAAAIAGPLVLFVLTALQVILGELVPKNIGVRFPERLAVATARPMRASAILLRPLVVVLNGCGNLVLRAMHLAPGAEAIHVHRPEEIVILTKESRAGGLLDAQEQRLLQNALGWRRLSVRQVMVPRTQILTAPESLPPTQMLSVLAESPHARLVLHGGSVDDIVGTVHLKDLLCLRDGDEVADVVRAPLYVPQDARAAEVFRALQRTGTPIAVVLDEYGGTAGMTTVGDLVEVLFGHLEGEFDAEPADIALTPDDRRAIVRGDVPVRDLNERLGLFLDEAEAETVGGLVLARAGHVPVDGEVVDVGGLTITVEEMDGHAVAGVSLEVTAAQLAVWRASE